jgi:heme/copper-type cytochrome/quinol oxidase subunit 2
MSSRRLPALLTLAGVVLAVVLFLVLKDDTADEDSTVASAPTESATGDAEQSNAEKKQEKPKPKPPEVPVIEIKGGQPVGGVKELEVAKGDEIRFIVKSDVDEEVHMHGYDVSQDVSAGGKVEFKVPATIEGVFEVELEHSVVPIAEISVVPS